MTTFIKPSTFEQFPSYSHMRPHKNVAIKNDKLLYKRLGIKHDYLSFYKLLQKRKKKNQPDNDYFYEQTMGKLKKDMPSSKFAIESDVEEYVSIYCTG